MNKLGIVMLLALVVCALGVVSAQDQARKAFVQLESAQRESRQIATRWDQLEVTQSTLAKSALIVEKANRKLSMRPVTEERTLHVNMADDGPRASASIQSSDSIAPLAALRKN